MNITRRDALKIGAFAGGALLLPIALQRRGYSINAGSPQPTPFQVNLPIPPILSPIRSDANTDYYEIKMQKSRVNILPGLTTEVWAYQGMVPGPRIIQVKDRKSVVRFVNNIDVSTSIHLHGMASEPQYDGYPEDLIPPGYYKDYHYKNQRAATLWYHDHAIHTTARNVYMGLAGMYIVQDPAQAALRLPTGKYDVPLIIQDKLFASDGSLVYNDDNHYGLMGDIILVNGAPFPKMEVSRRKYRFRVLNASTSRSYNLALSNKADLIAIASDCGLLTKPAPTKELRIGMAERYEFVIDFSAYPIGTQIVLQNLSLPNNKDYDLTGQIMRFDVVGDAVEDSTVPTTLSTIPPIKQPSIISSKVWSFDRRSEVWVINGNTWDKNRIDANPGFETTETWTFINNARTWFHPVHVHLVDFQILNRNGKPPLPYESGWKDTVYLGENDNIQVIAKFEPHRGKYVIHCHNTVHEDHDMMSQYQIGTGGIDPMSAPAKPLPAPPL